MSRSQRTKIPGGEMIEVAQRAKPAVESALAQMMMRRHALRPFVILTDVATGKFVQWAGSAAERILFDVPALGISVRMDGVPAAAARGLEVLSQLAIRPLEMPFSEGLLLEESDTHDESDVQKTARTLSN